MGRGGEGKGEEEREGGEGRGRREGGEGKGEERRGGEGRGGREGGREGRGRERRGGEGRGGEGGEGGRGGEGKGLLVNMMEKETFSHLVFTYLVLLCTYDDRLAGMHTYVRVCICTKYTYHTFYVYKQLWGIYLLSAI